MYERISVIETFTRGKAFEPSCILESPVKLWPAKEVNIYCIQCWHFGKRKV